MIPSRCISLHIVASSSELHFIIGIDFGGSLCHVPSVSPRAVPVAPVAPVAPVVPVVPVVKALKEAMDKGTCALGTPGTSWNTNSGNSLKIRCFHSCS